MPVPAPVSSFLSSPAGGIGRKSLRVYPSRGTRYPIDCRFDQPRSRSNCLNRIVFAKPSGSSRQSFITHPGSQIPFIPNGLPGASFQVQ